MKTKYSQPKEVFKDISKAYMEGKKAPSRTSKPRGCGAATKGCTPCKEC